MASDFELVTDNSGRINYFLPKGHDEPIQPAQMGGYIDDDDRITHKDREFVIQPNGSLVHPDVEVPEGVFLGAGVLLERNVSLRPELEPKDGKDGTITILSGSRIKGTEIHSGVTIGSYALILAKYIGQNSAIGSRSRLRADVVVAHDAFIGDNVKVDRESIVGIGATLEDGVELGFKTRIGVDATVEAGTKIGKSTGEGPRDLNQDGEFIMPNSVIRKDNLRRLL